jgi:hypothetical protein
MAWHERQAEAWRYVRTTTTSGTERQTYAAPHFSVVPGGVLPLRVTVRTQTRRVLNTACAFGTA